mgnify:CR=1 FL=1
MHSSSPNCSGQTTGTCNGDIIEQPANFETLSDRYGSFAQVAVLLFSLFRKLKPSLSSAKEFIGNVSRDPSPFFLYVPFSHVHVPQYYNPAFKGKSGRGPFYDTLMELDHTVGTILQALKDNNVDNNTLVVWGLGRVGGWVGGR